LLGVIYKISTSLEDCSVYRNGSS